MAGEVTLKDTIDVTLDGGDGPVHLGTFKRVEPQAHAWSPPMPEHCEVGLSPSVPVQGFAACAWPDDHVKAFEIAKAAREAENQQRIDDAYAKLGDEIDRRDARIAALEERIARVERALLGG